MRVANDDAWDPGIAIQRNRGALRRQEDSNELIAHEGEICTLAIAEPLGLGFAWGMANTVGLGPRIS